MVGLEKALRTEEETLISWLSFNIHGDEASSSEAALRLIYHLSQNKPFPNQLIIIDPCLNPDGRERYVQWFHSVHQKSNTFDKNAVEYHPVWPQGRFNHHLADLNRDWLWQIQSESRQRLSLFNTWMPHLHADFHEMEISKTYFFPPTAEPIHEVVKESQLNALNSIGEDLKVLFKQEDWKYFNAKEFDLLYPSYGDTYATYNGAIGLTLEQAGSGEAGLLYVKKSGDTLRLTGRIEKHFEVAKNILTNVSKQREGLLVNFQEFHTDALKNGSGKYETYLLKNENAAKIKVLTGFLDRLEIEYTYAGEQSSAMAYDFHKKKNDNTHIAINDLIISTKQVKGHLVRVLFEPQSKMAAMKTYDITSWALPYLHHLKAYGLQNSPSIELKSKVSKAQEPLPAKTKAISISWNSASSGQFLSALLKENIAVHVDSLLNPNLYVLANELNPALLKLAHEKQLTLGFLNAKQWRNVKSEGIKLIENQHIAVLIGEENRRIGNRRIDFLFRRIFGLSFYQDTY